MPIDSNCSPERTDSQYYEVARPNSLGERLLIRARDGIFDDFLRLVRPDAQTRIIDVGVSDMISEGANVLERRYPHPENITAVGLGDGVGFQSAFPRVAYRRIEANRPLPFADDSFDVAWANAVLEHVGSSENQRAFIAELLRVAPHALLTVPNRYFPVEHHTAIPLLHYCDITFRLACRVLRREHWAQRGNLILMSTAGLRRLRPPGARVRIGYTGLALGPFSSNIYLHVSRPMAPTR